MNKAKKLFKYLFFLMLFITVWVSLNSIDDSSYNDLGILSNLKTVSDNENGYVVISYLNSPEYEMFDTQAGYDRLRRHIYGSEWDQAFVNKVLTDKEKIITDIEAATKKPYFKLPDYDSIFYLPEYSGFINASRLLILKTIDQINTGNLAGAVGTLKTTLKYSQLLKTEENATILSHMIGLFMQYESIRWVHFFLQDESINYEVLKNLQEVMELVGDYENDGFKKVFYGEFNFSVIISEEMKNKSLKQKLSEYWDAVELMNEYPETDEKYQAFGLGFARLIQEIIPDYYVHPNEALSKNAPLMIKLAGQSQNYCNNISFVSDKREPSWFDVFAPNSLTEQWVGIGTELYRDFYYRRCLSHIYFDSVRSFIGIKQYIIENGNYPDNLEQLTPKYLERLPVDYFNGETLRYSKVNGWLYSVGANFENNNGSDDGIYNGRCMNDEPCYENPTILIIPKKLKWQD